MERLQQALALLGYTQTSAPHHRNNLIGAISQFALVNGDSELEAACEQELANIRATAAVPNRPA